LTDCPSSAASLPVSFRFVPVFPLVPDGPATALPLFVRLFLTLSLPFGCFWEATPACSLGSNAGDTGCVDDDRWFDVEVVEEAVGGGGRDLGMGGSGSESGMSYPINLGIFPAPRSSPLYFDSACKYSSPFCRILMRCPVGGAAGFVPSSLMNSPNLDSL